MKIVLINPSSGPVYSKFKRSPIKRLPLGLAYVASFLDGNGYEVSVVDVDALDLSIEQAVSTVLDKNPDIVGISATTPIIQSATEILKSIKRENRSIYTIIGGPHSSAIPQDTLVKYNDFIDYVVFGEGEHTALDIVHAIDAGKAFSHPVAGAVFMGTDGKPVMGSPRAMEEDLDVFPFPARHLFPMEKYVDHTKTKFSRENYTMLTTSRGCPFDCIFCGSKSTWGRRTRYRSPENVVAEIRECVETYGITNFVFCDDTFTLRQERTIDICRLITELPYKLNLYVSSRADTISDDRLEWLKKAGCYCITYGIESGNDEIMKIMRKKETVDNNRKAVELTKKWGIEAHGSFIIGNAGDTEETIEETIDFAISLDLDQVQFSILVPLPATPSYDMAMERDAFRCAPDNYEEFYWYYSVAANLTRGVSDERLIELQKHAYERWKTSKALK